MSNTSIGSHGKPRQQRSRQGLPIRGRISGLLLALVVVVGIVKTAAADETPAKERTKRPPVVLISIDGLLPAYYRNADKLKLKIPNIRAIVDKGTSADGATSVMPTLTFPAHTSMITGQPPAVHGIIHNDIFDPDTTLGGGWHYFYADLKAKNLFGVARAQGLVTASVTWPVTAGAPIDFNLPDMYPTPNLREAKNMIALAQNAAKPWADLLPPPKELVHLSDEIRTKVALRFLQEKPDFCAIHFLELDTAQHKFGPHTPQAFDALERIDEFLGQVIEALDETTTLVVVSDHGFIPTTQEIHMGVLLRLLGIGHGNNKGKMTNWRATVFGAGGSAAVFLAPDANAQDKRRLDDALALMLSNPDYGVERVLRGKDAVATGGFPGAYAILDARPGFGFMGEKPDTTELVGPTNTMGLHGYHPGRPEMRSSFMIRGPQIRPGFRIKAMRLVDIAPTIAKILSLPWEKTEGRVLTEIFAKP